MMYLTLFLIQVICVCITDVLGAVDEMLTPIVRKVTGSRIGKLGKPWNCSTCQTFWLGLIYILLTGTFSVYSLAFLVGLAVMTPVTYLTINFVRDFLEKIIGIFYDFLGI